MFQSQWNVALYIANGVCTASVNGLHTIFAGSVLQCQTCFPLHHAVTCGREMSMEISSLRLSSCCFDPAAGCEVDVTDGNSFVASKTHKMVLLKSLDCTVQSPLLTKLRSYRTILRYYDEWPLSLILVSFLDFHPPFHDVSGIAGHKFKCSDPRV